MKILRVLWGLATVVLVCTSCQEGGIGSRRCTLHVELVRDTAVSGLTIEPDTPLVIDGYTVSGDGPLGTSFSVGTREESVSVENLIPGQWELRADARNAEAVLLATGAAVVELQGDRRTVEIVLEPVAGTGTLAVSLRWDSSRIVAQSLDIALTGESGAVTPLHPVFGALGGEIFEDVDAGLYVFTVRIRDGEAVVGGCAEVVRVVAGGVSAAVIEIPVEPLSTAVIISLTVPDLRSLPVVLSAPRPPFFTGETYGFTASTDGSTAEARWFLGGSQVSVGRSFELVPGEAGAYRLDALVLDSGAGRGGSAGLGFTVVEPVLYGDYVFMESFVDNRNTVDGLGGARALTITPDGAHLYVAGYSEAKIGVFELDQAQARPAFLYAQRETPEVSLFGVTDLAVSSDGSLLFAAAARSGTVASFSRNPASGTLTPLASFDPLAADAPGTERIAAVAVSPDDRFLYAAGAQTGTVYVLTFDETAGVTGVSSSIGPEDLPAGIIAKPEAVQVSPDGLWCSVADWEADSLLIFARDPADGGLTLEAWFQNDVGGVTSLNGASGVAFAPDSGGVYATAYYGSAVTYVRRDPVSGAWTVEGVWTNADGAVEGMRYARAVVVSEEEAFVCASGDDAIVLFRRDPADGSLSFVTAVRDGEDRVGGLDGVRDLCILPEGKGFVSAASNDNAVAYFARW